jgi:subtilisin family serine protease
VSVVDPGVDDRDDHILAKEARKAGHVDGTGLAVAVLDTGLNIAHVDFAGQGRIPACLNFTSEDGGDPNTVTDRIGHGSNVAGIIAAHGSKHTGIAPGANIVTRRSSGPARSPNVSTSARTIPK